MSQSELARRTGLTQGTIAGLLSGRSRSSAHLHKIARVAQTTPAYLDGETDDPNEDAPAIPEVTFEEQEVLDLFRVLTPADKSLVTQLLRSLSGKASEPKGYSSTVHTTQQDYHGPPRQRAAA